MRQTGLVYDADNLILLIEPDGSEMLTIY